MTKIKFGTDGWRAIIAREFTVENVARVAEATAKWMKSRNENPSVVIGHDCRFAGKLFAETTAAVMIMQGVKVYLAEGFVSTPMVSLGAISYKADLGVVLTASHNPPEYNGFKLKGAYGGPLLPDKIEEIENPLTKQVRYLDKLVDELAKGKKMEKTFIFSLVFLDKHQLLCPKLKLVRKVCSLLAFRRRKSLI